MLQLASSIRLKKLNPPYKSGPSKAWLKIKNPNAPAATRATPDVAMMHSEFHIYGDVDEPTRTGIGTRVVRKIDGRWRTVAVQNTDVRVGRRH